MSEAAEIRKAILAQSEPFYAAVAWPGVEMGLRIRAMTVGERDAFDRETSKRAKKSPHQVRARERMLIACLCTANGEKVFTPADEEALSALAAPHVERAFRVCCKANGYEDDSGDDAGN